MFKYCNKHEMFLKPNNCNSVCVYNKVLTKKWRTKPEGKYILSRIRYVESLTNALTQLLYRHGAKAF